MKKLLLPFLFAILLTIVLTFPAILHMNTYFIGDGADNYQFAGFQFLVADNLSQGKWPLADNNHWYYPNGFALSRGFDSVFFSVGGGLLLWLTGQPVLTYNLSIFLALIFNFMATYLLLRQLKLKSPFNLIGATIFGFSFYALARGAGHANLILVGGFPLLVAAILRLKESGSKQNFAFLALAVIILGLSSAQYLALALISGLLLLPALLIFYFKESKQFFQNLFKEPQKILLTVLGVIIILGPFLWPLFSAYLKQDYQARDPQADYSPMAIDLVIANPFTGVMSSKLAQATQTKHIEHVVYLGLIEMLLLVFYLPGLFFKHKRLRFTLTALLLSLVFALGTKNPETEIFLPYHYLRDFFPFSVVPEAGRFIIISYLLLATSIAFILQRKFFPLNEERKLILATIIFLLVVERFNFAGYFQVQAPTRTLGEAVQNTPAKAVLDLPILSNQQANVLPAFYGKSTVFNQGHWLSHTKETREFVAQSGLHQFICQPHLYFKDQSELSEKPSFETMLDNLTAINATTIVLHRDHKLDWPECAKVLEIVSREFPRLMTAIPSQGENSEAHLRWSSTPLQSGFFFPKKGKVKIFGLEYAPAESAKLEITLDGQAFDLSKYKEKVFPRPIEGFTLNLDALDKNSGSFEVQAGSILSIKSPLVPVEQGFLTIWYHYQVDPRSSEQATLKQGRLERVYFDETSEVYTIH